MFIVIRKVKDAIAAVTKCDANINKTCGRVCDGCCKTARLGLLAGVLLSIYVELHALKQRAVRYVSISSDALFSLCCGSFLFLCRRKTAFEFRGKASAYWIYLNTRNFKA